MNEVSTQFLDEVIRALNYPLLKLGQAQVTLSSICVFIGLLVALFVVERLLRRHFLDRALQRTNLDPAARYTAGKLFEYGFLTVGVYISLQIVGIDLSSLALVAGAIGVGLGFGLQNVISNFVSGIILLFERTLKVGDFIELESKITGEVKEIKLRCTHINTNENIDILVPNSELVNKHVINWTLAEANRRIHVPYGVAYGSDKELVRQAGLEAADAVSFTIKDQEKRRPQVWFKGFGASSLDFELVVWVNQDAVKRPGAVQAAYLWELHTALYKYGVEIPFPQNDLHLRSVFGLKDEVARRWIEERFPGGAPRPDDASGAS